MRLLTILIVALSGSVLTALADGSAITISDPYLRETIPGQSRTAGFFTVVNEGASDCVLASAQSATAERLEIHEHSHQDGVMRMRQVPSLTIPAGQSVTLSPGGYHLMVFGTKAPYQAGEQVPVTLDFGDCGELDALFDVRKIR